MELRDRQATYQGFGDALALGVELVMTPILLGLFGFWLDSRLGTWPAFMFAFGLLGVAGVSVRTYYDYKARMAKEEEGKPWTRPRP